ncbi:hypothetical protein [Streptomyces sp. MP131-18]|uniref:hypothetical protein n=1 Tax=Streptomyces sp. MP131-18 TaxID=1857892 RepID=UPI00097C2FAE|nr:hypothetical protein [Streptomyces sp. MP131-18]ONK13260.1 hypothetical protein STBA_40230 [Streptomyces sp. MP131-18]
MAQARYQRTVDLPLDHLTPFPGNAKRGHVPTILESLCRNGQYRSLVIREVGPALIVLAGNHTLQALAAHGPGDCGLTVTVAGEERPCGICHNQPWDPVARCEIVSCDDDTAARINLVDNRAPELGTYDTDALAELIAGLDDDLGGTGYTETDLEDLLKPIEPLADETVPDVLTLENPEDTPEPAAPETTGATERPTADVAGDHPLDATPQPPASDQTGDTALRTPSPVEMLFTFTAEDRAEAGHLITVARDLLGTDLNASAVVLRALQTLIAVLHARDSPDSTVTPSDLLTTTSADSTSRSAT